MNYYRRFMGDYNSKTADLSLAEHGAYNVLLDTCYSTEKGLWPSYEALCRICRAMSKTEQEAVKSVADRFFPIGADGLRHNPRADEEIAKAQVTIAKQRESGVESAAKRWSTDGSTHKSTDGSAIQPLTANHYPSAVNLQSPPKVKRTSAAPKDGAAAPGKTVPVWTAYSEAYQRRYGTAPVRNAKVNGMLGKFLDRLPADEAPTVAAFYVNHNRGFYVSAKHPIDLLLRDAEGLRTEWATNRTVTDTAARQIDQTQARGDVFTRLIAESEADE